MMFHPTLQGYENLAVALGTTSTSDNYW